MHPVARRARAYAGHLTLLCVLPAPRPSIPYAYPPPPIPPFAPFSHPHSSSLSPDRVALQEIFVPKPVTRSAT